MRVVDFGELSNIDISSYTKTVTIMISGELKTYDIGYRNEVKLVVSEDEISKLTNLDESVLSSTVIQHAQAITKKFSVLSSKTKNKIPKQKILRLKELALEMNSLINSEFESDEDADKKAKNMLGLWGVRTVNFNEIALENLSEDQKEKISAETMKAFQKGK